MSHLFGSVWWFLVTLGVLVTFHEFGHFWVARRFGVRVLKFSVGFGKPLWSRKGKDGVEYAIGAIPLGGYVKFLDAREADNPDYVSGQPGEFNAAPVWQRMAIAAAGPVFNFVFAVFAIWAMFVIGRPDFQPVIGSTKALASQGGFEAGDRIVAVNGEATGSWSAAAMAIEINAIQHHDVVVDVVDTQGRAVRRALKLSLLPASAADNAKLPDLIGLQLQMPPVVGQINPGSPADHGGLHAGDLVEKIDATPIRDFDQITEAINADAAKNPLLTFVVRRGDARVSLDVRAEQVEIEGVTKWRIGVGPAAGTYDAVERYGPLRAVPAAFHETWKSAATTMGLLYQIVSGNVSIKNVHSAITIAQVADQSARMGPAWFLAFLAQISLALGILNLLPIPILDGGHLLYYLIELVKGRPLSERTLIAGQYVGLALLVTLMSIAFYNDIVG